MTKQQETVSDLDIQALVDNQGSLSGEDRARIQQAVDQDPALRRRFEDLQRQKRLLQAWWEENKKDTLQ